jgi:hypothetical protein
LKLDYRRQSELAQQTVERQVYGIAAAFPTWLNMKSMR